jgi:hypothetical protein
VTFPDPKLNTVRPSKATEEILLSKMYIIRWWNEG